MPVCAPGQINHNYSFHFGFLLFILLTRGTLNLKITSRIDDDVCLELYDIVYFTAAHSRAGGPYHMAHMELDRFRMSPFQSYLPVWIARWANSY